MKKIAWLLPLLFAAPLFAQNDAIQGYCDRGGTHSLVSGLPATNWQLGNIPACTVTVYFTGTTTKVPALYADSLGTPLSNPFTATTSTSPNPGYWIFWAPVGVGYDVTMSGGGGVPTCTTQPNCYAIPITKTDLKVGGGGGGSGVTSFSAGNLPPLFTTTVTNPGTTPALGFAQSNAAANTIFGNFNSTTGPPFFAVFTCTGLLTCTYNSSTNVWNVNIPTTSTLSVTSTDPIKVNGGNGPVASGTANISCPDCGQANILPLLIPPIAGQYVILHPTSVTPFLTGNCLPPPGFPPVAYDNNSGLLYLAAQVSGFPPSTCRLTWSFAGALAAQAPQVVPANVTSIYATAVSSYFDAVGSNLLFTGPSTLSFIPSGIPAGFSYALQQSTSGATAYTGATIDTAFITAELSRSGTPSQSVSIYTINAPSLFVFYTGTAPAVDNSIKLAPPFTLTVDDTGSQVLGIDPNFPRFLIPQPLVQAVAKYPAGGQKGFVIAINDGVNAADCTVGGGSTNVLCQSNNTVYVAVGGTASGTYTTEVVSCTTTCTLSNTPIVFDNLSVNGLVMVNGTDFTLSGTTITLTTPAVGGDVYYAQYHR